MLNALLSSERWTVLSPFRMSVRQKVSPETPRRYQSNHPSAPKTPPSLSHPRALPLQRYTVYSFCWNLDGFTATDETLFAGVKRNWRHGPCCCGPEAGEEAHRDRGGRGGGSWRAGGKNFSKLPKEEEKALDEFPEQFFLWLHSHQRGILVQPFCLESFTERWKSLNTL